MNLRKVSYLLVTFLFVSNSYSQFILRDVETTISHENPSRLAFADFNNDGTLDVFITGVKWNNGVAEGVSTAVWFNNGSGDFSKSSQEFDNKIASLGVSVGDLDNDNDLDVFISNYCGLSEVWLNDGNGIFVQKPQSIGTLPSYDLSLGDIDNDGDLDVYLATYHDCNDEDKGTPDRILLNDGDANFTVSDQLLSDRQNEKVILFDMDKDGDLDAYVTSWGEKDILWSNDSGIFTLKQEFSINNSVGLDIGDVNNDGYPDIILAAQGYGQSARPNKLLINNKDGSFSMQIQEIGNNISTGVKLGDLDKDGDLDAYFINWGTTR